LKKNSVDYSIVIPAYNSAKHIEKAVLSCINQTFQPGEIIIIDDGSTDDTYELLKKINSPLIRIYQNKINKGVSYSRNVGIKKSRCAWVLFLDADDIFHKYKLETLDMIISKNNHIRVLAHEFVVSLNQEKLNMIEISKDFKLKKVKLRKLLFKNLFVTPSVAFYRKSGVLFDESFTHAEDHDFLLRLLEREIEFWYFNSILCSISRFPLSPGGLSSNNLKMRFGELKLYKNFCERNKLLLLLPFLYSFSGLKHIRRFLLTYFLFICVLVFL